MLITNSFVNIGIILIANILIDGWTSGLHWNFSVFVLIKVVAVTFLLVLFAEVLPKFGPPIAKYGLPPRLLWWWKYLTASFTVSEVMVRFSDGIEKQFSPESTPSMDSSKLDDAIDLLPEHGATVEEKQILKGIRKFSDTTVKQISTLAGCKRH